MNRSSLTLLILLSVGALTTGCDRQPPTSPHTGPATDHPAAARELQDHPFAQRAEFTAEMRRHLADINQEIDRLSVKIENSSAAVQAAAQPKLQALREQAARLNTGITDAENATESTWDSVKNGARETYAALVEGFQESRQWLSEKIAP